MQPRYGSGLAEPTGCISEQEGCHGVKDDHRRDVRKEKADVASCPGCLVNGGVLVSANEDTVHNEADEAEL